MDISARLKTALADRYRVEREIGAGGMATVYLAEDLRHHRRVAVKVLRPDLAAILGPGRFAREIEIAAQLTHPHILPLHDSGEADGLLFYVMPFVEGESLRSRVERDGALPVSDVVRLLRDIVDALAHAHARHVVHRDIKPDNVMLSGRHALVTDFGVAKAVSEAGAGGALTTVGVSLGTPSYMAPEQATADPSLDHRADLYAVGVVGYELLTGRLPFAGPTAQAVLAAHLTERPRPVAEIRAGAPPALAKIIMRLLEKHPDHRYQTANELLADLEQLATPSGGVTPISAAVATPRRRMAVLLVALGVLLLGGWAWTSWRKMERRQWVHAEALPAMQRLLDSGEVTAAWRLGREARAVLPQDSSVARLWQAITTPLTLRTVPSGARVYRSAVNEPSDSAWEYLGETPLDSVAIPRSRGLLRIEKDGYRSILALSAGGPIDAVQSEWTLDDGNSSASGMVAVPGRTMFELNLPGYEHLANFYLDTFALDIHEITNRQYKLFVDSGGYRRPEFWTEPFFDGGVRLTFEAAMARFTDRTGRQGPATWEGGAYPPGRDDHPVGGVSWYEAAAYARFAGKSLPSAYHWVAAAGVAGANVIIRRSNFSGQGTVPVGTLAGAGVYGTRDMAGNVREWTTSANSAAPGAARFILGGGYSDPSYAFNDAYAQPPLNRSDINGIRLARFRSGDTTLARATRPLVVQTRDFARMRPAANDVYRAYARVFEYDRTPLHARIERTDTLERYILQHVSFDAAYGGERMSGRLFLPRTGGGPFQTILFWPGSNALFLRTFSAAYWWQFIDYLVNSGRAVFVPIYKSTYERGDGFQSDIPSQTAAFRDHVAMWVKDARRSIDYLVTRADIDSARIGYYGISWGGAMGAFVPAVEPRIRAVALNVAGALQQEALPEVEQIHYLPRVTQPVLMLNGRYDFYFPVETSQRPFFNLLGTPAQHKRQVIYESSHFVPRTALITELLAWYDRYLGEVAR